eukprot:11256017-Alexandrium_andersonii.AAC.1
MFPEFFGDNLAEFWRNVRPDDPKLALLGDLTNTPGWENTVVPYVIHADAAPVTEKSDQGLVSVNMKGLLCKSSSWMLPLVTVIKNCLSKKSWDMVWKLLRFLLDALYEGVHPATDPWGTPWAEGSKQRELVGKPICKGKFKFVLWVYTGDLE